MRWGSWATWNWKGTCCMGMLIQSENTSIDWTIFIRTIRFRLHIIDKIHSNDGHRSITVWKSSTRWTRSRYRRWRYFSLHWLFCHQVYSIYLLFDAAGNDDTDDSDSRDEEEEEDEMDAMDANQTPNTNSAATIDTSSPDIFN